MAVDWRGRAMRPGGVAAAVAVAVVVSASPADGQGLGRWVCPAGPELPFIVLDPPPPVDGDNLLCAQGVDGCEPSPGTPGSRRAGTARVRSGAVVEPSVPSGAYGSVALSGTGSGGYRWGAAWQANAQAARWQALARCQAAGGRSCRELSAGQAACVALGLKTDGRWAVSWGRVRAAVQADLAARCRAEGAECRVVGARCAPPGSRGRR